MLLLLFLLAACDNEANQPTSVVPPPTVVAALAPPSPVPGRVRLEVTGDVTATLETLGPSCDEWGDSRHVFVPKRPVEDGGWWLSAWPGIELPGEGTKPPELRMGAGGINWVWDAASSPEASPSRVAV